MTPKKINILLIPTILLGVVLSVLPVSGKAQDVPDIFRNRFIKNLDELSKLYYFTDSTYYPGKFKFQQIENVEGEYKNLDLVLFPKTSDLTSGYFQFLNGLESVDKQNLVRFFSIYESEFEGLLKSAGLPVELKYLAPSISAMNFMASDEKGRSGIWQLTHFQAVLNGARVDNLIDERLNILLSTQFAVRQLKQNFGMFEDKNLAVAAFLFGNTKVKNAIYLAGENASFENVLKYLPDSFSKHIAAFQAMAIFLNVNKFEHFSEPFTPESKPDTVKIYKQLHFQQVADVIGIPLSQLRFLNPHYKFSIVPKNDNPEVLILPDGYWDDFVLWNDSIYNSYDSLLFQVIVQKIAYPPAPNRQYLGEPVKDLEIEGKTKIKYRIKTGDVLGIIAENYHVRVADLKYWNNIYNERKIQAGQKIDIFVDNEKAEFYVNLQNQIEKKTVEDTNDFVEQIKKSVEIEVLQVPDLSIKIEHVVQSGESPYVIANKYDGVTPELILEWNKIDDPRKIQIGQKLILYLNR
ncbi:MAG: LysM peptidoglycan-binding domain-containing protein [Prolixibacteraceae bacterium]|nr:LysM peptidoglycan-binding domain-containing protein [Prolixibacteraceae bacterium]MBT6007091.1 LysM peptidoglycan-binding domain-containing protein [Prolixibacteraceae bacterium]MBT6763795.1 LysM peptidoglycan-binding domain-containing protein [Prolixibacteraceae bacterium]MBT7000366.1 LysM peptidoglycan-binding domain-containing protein [Prolixibacteraceae bacterium]MBT7393602.1 LysM peptidoglycan-binding domain-containing protein [Prolixibacteraceae bacterium]